YRQVGGMCDDEDADPYYDQRDWRRLRPQQSLEEIYNLLRDFATTDEVVIKAQTKTERADKLLSDNSQKYCLCRIKFEQNGQTVGIPEGKFKDCKKIVLLNNRRKYEYNDQVVVRVIERKVGRPVEGIIKTRYEVIPAYRLYRPEKFIGKRTTVLCIVHLADSFNSWAQPVSDETITRIILPSRAACACAADGDACYVKLLNPEDRGSDKQLFGRVVAIKQQAHKLKHKLLLCRIVPGSYAHMEPLCGTVPRITYANLHAQRYDAEVTKKFKEHIGKETQRPDMEYEERLRFANSKYVTLFSVKLDPDNVPFFRARAAVKVNKDNCDKLFLVCYSLWEVGYPYPKGHVVAIINKKDFEPMRDLLLSVQFSLPFIKPDEEMEAKLKTEVSKVASEVNKCCSDAGREDCRSLLAVTIDEETTRMFDDALSLAAVSENVYEIGVHVTDASYYIENNSALDRTARENLIELEGNDAVKHSAHLFPQSLSLNWLSLVANQSRKCLSVFFTVRFDEASSSFSIESKRIIPTVIKVRCNLKKSQVTEVLTQNESPECRDDKEVASMLKFLCKISIRWRLDRLGEAAFCQSPRTGEPPVDQNFEASCLVEEFILKANFAVAEFLKKEKARNYPIRVQNPPREADVAAWLRNHGATVDHSSELSRYLCDLLLVVPDEPASSLILDCRDFDDLRVTSDKRKFLLRLFSEKQFSHLLPAISAWHRISNRAEYRIVRSEPSKHFSLNTEDYVQFTSPLWRYTDLLIHRHLRVALKVCDQSSIGDAAEDIQNFEQSVNKKEVTLINLQKKRQEIDFGLNLNSNTQRFFPATVESVGEGYISLACSPSTKAAVLSNLIVNPSHMGLFSSPTISEGLMELAWNLRVYYHEDFVRRGQCVAKIDRSAEPQTDRGQLQRDSNSIQDGVTQDVLLKIQSLKRSICEAVGDYSQIDIHDLRLMLAEVGRVEEQVDIDEVHSDPGIQRTNILNALIKHPLKLTIGKILKVQLCSDSQTELQTAVVPQLLEICPNLCICLQHRSRPIPTLVSLALHDAPTSYKDIEHYSKVWLGLLRMESANACISDENVFVIHHVPLTLHWNDRRKKHRAFALFSLSEHFCERRGISFAQVEVKSSEENEQISDERLLIEADNRKVSSDYACIRIPETRCNNIIVLHGSVALVYKTGDMFKVIVYLDGKCDEFAEPTGGYKNVTTATVEVIKKPMPLLREELTIANLDETVNDQLSRNLDDNIIMSLIFWSKNSIKRVSRNSGDYFRYLQDYSVRSFAVKVLVESDTNRLLATRASPGRSATP
ncbi:hypothetical protein BOX15_Mlig002666g1, partial [Macrostomum lignano]